LNAARHNTARGLCVIGAVALMGVIAACEPAPRTTRLTIDEFQQMADAMARSLVRSDAFADRDADSPRWIVSMTKVRNLTSDVMTEAEQWAIMSDLRGSAPLRALWDTKNVRFVLDAKRGAKLAQDADEGRYTDIEPNRTPPTHTLTATFRSATRATREARTDLYFCEFQLQDLRTGETVWNDRFEIKREALGHVWD